MAWKVVIYALSAVLRDAIAATGEALVRPISRRASRWRGWSQLSRPREGRSAANQLRTRAGIEGVKAGLLREVLSPDALADPVRLAQAIKALPLRLVAPRPLDEAISSAGGVSFDALDARRMIRSLPGCSARARCWTGRPTGEYLLRLASRAGGQPGWGERMAERAARRRH
jgi:predicted flavoprotein YhiN